MNLTLLSKLLLNTIVALIVTVSCIFLLKPIAIKLGLQDMPGGRKQHKYPTPVIGGIGMFIGFCFALLTLGNSLEAYRGFLGASALLVFVGVLDDLHELTARARLIAQVAAALLMVFWGGNVLTHFGNLFFLGDFKLGYFAIPITVFATVGVINAVNMLDGVDGLLGSTALVQMGLLAFLAWNENFVMIFNVLILLMAVLIGYLLFNFPFTSVSRAKVFMGDAGSMFLGFCLAWFFIRLTQLPTTTIAPVIMLWIFAIPLFDATWLLIKRMLNRKNPLLPDRNHLHHLLQAKGYAETKISCIVSGLSLLTGLVGIIAWYFHVTQGLQFIAFIIFFSIYCLILKMQWQRIEALLQS